MMWRTDCLKEIAKLRGDALVVAVYSTAFEWIGISPHPLNFLSVGAMGQASSSALGFAIGLPDRRIIVLDGDGSLLMNLGTLVTIAAVTPTNLVHFVFHNGCYEANGSLPIPNQQVDFAGIARSAGIRSCHTIHDLADFKSQLPSLLATPGPVFADLWVEQGTESERDYAEMYSAKRRDAFRAALRG
jgi:phosphonopyruvate decarboxylase